MKQASLPSFSSDLERSGGRICDGENREIPGPLLDILELQMICFRWKICRFLSVSQCW